MPTLSDQLKSLGVKLGARDLPPPPPRHAHAIERVVPGRFHPTSHGEAFVAETTFPLEYRHGQMPLSLTSPLGTMADWAKEPRLARSDASRLVFLDIETTGLAGGTGTYAFLVGIGRYGGDGFQLAQFFMRDPVEEPAVLTALLECLHPLGTLVTFNGKAFDAPILRTRYILNGYDVPFASAGHLDLLPLARRLWRARLESRALGSLEMHILKATRAEQDIPGWLIPQMYFDYLRSGDARPLKGVFYHNAMDVVAMAALLSHTAQMLEQPLTFAAEHGLDLYSIGRIFEDLGRLDEAAAVYARAVELEVPEDILFEAIRRLSMVHRRRGQVEAAVKLWRQAAELRQVYAFVELAKYYEHRVGDIAEAVRQTRAGLDVVRSPGFPPTMGRRWVKDLDHRLQRLEAKQMRVDRN